MAKYFKTSEFCVSASHPELVKVPAQGTEIYNNIQRLAAELDKVREKYGNPIYVSSGWRPKALNDKVGGSSTSAHLSALAADVYSGKGVEENVNILKAAIASGIKQDQYIAEYPVFDKNGRMVSIKWLHIGLSKGTPRGQTLYYDGKSYKPLKVNSEYTFSK